MTEDGQGRVSAPSPRVTVVLIAAPEPPPGLNAVAGEREVRLAWEPPPRLVDGTPVPGPLAYEVLRAAEPATGGASPSPRRPSRPRRFVDRTLENDRTYYYAVRALRQEGDTLARGAPTAPVAATPRDMTPPAPPTDLVAIPHGDSVRLGWKASPDADVATYVVYRARAGAGLRPGGLQPAARGPPTSMPASPPGTYRYAVTALDGGAAQRKRALQRGDGHVAGVPSNVA